MIEAGDKYIIDGPANLRNKPHGKIIATLKHGRSVKALEVFESEWVRISFESTSKSVRSSVSGPYNGWTFVSNLRPYPRSLGDLVSGGYVQILKKSLLIDIENPKAEILKEPLYFNSDQYDYPEESHNRVGVATPQKPFLINAYCLDGTFQENEVVSVEFEWGVEATRAITVNTKDEPPKGDCILVNGIIAKEKNKKSGKPKTDKLCPPTLDQFTLCEYQIGDFNNDGVLEGILNTGKLGAPYMAWWKLFSVDEDGEIQILGEIGFDASP